MVFYVTIGIQKENVYLDNNDFPHMSIQGSTCPSLIVY